MLTPQWRQLDLFAGVRSYIVDVIAFKDIDEIIAGTGYDSDRITIKYSSNESVTLIARPDSSQTGSPPDTGLASLDAARASRAEFENLIRSARANVREPTSTVVDRVLRPNDVPGTLLCLALTNLCSSDEVLRSSAYALLGEAVQFLGLDLGTKLLKVDGELLPILPGTLA